MSLIGVPRARLHRARNAGAGERSVAIRGDISCECVLHVVIDGTFPVPEIKCRQSVGYERGLARGGISMTTTPVKRRGDLRGGSRGL